MKKITLSLILFCISIIGIVFIGCELQTATDCDGTIYRSEIDGIWTNSNFQIIFSESNKWEKTVYGENHSSGYYKIDAEAKTLQITLYYYWTDNAWVYQSQEIKANLEYELNDTTLILKNNDNEKEIPMNGIYTSPNSNSTSISQSVGC